MKYLKRINEGVDKDELEKFCNDNLASLIDNHFEFKIDYYNILNNNFIVILLFKNEKVGSDNMHVSYEWEDIKYDIEPFIVSLNSNYKFNKTWHDDKTYIEVVEEYDRKRYTYEQFIQFGSNYYFDDDKIRYIEIILDNN